MPRPLAALGGPVGAAPLGPHRSLTVCMGGAALVLSGCTGAFIADVMPGTDITVDGSAFTVSDRPGGVTLRNFETGRTPPAVLMNRAGRAAELVTGCTLASITQETGVNTYYAGLDCPAGSGAS